MANVADLLRKNKDKIDKIKKDDVGRKKIKRTTTRPWHDLAESNDKSATEKSDPVKVNEKPEVQNIIEQDLVVELKNTLPAITNTMVESKRLTSNNEILLVNQNEALELETKTLSLTLDKTKSLPRVSRKTNVKRSEKIELLNSIKVEKNFFKIPNNLLGHVIFEKELGIPEIRVLTVLLRLSIGFKNNYVKITQKEISHITKNHITNVNKITKGLIKKGVIRQQKYNGNENVYIIDDSLLSSDPYDFILARHIEYKNMNKLKTRQVSNSNQTVSKNESTNASSNIMFSLKIDETLTSFSGTNKFKEMNNLNQLIVEGSKSIEEIEKCIQNLKVHGDLKGEKVDRPFSYLVSGVFDKILSRAEGKSKSSMDGQKIIDILSSYPTKDGMTDEIKEQLNKYEIDWIESKGGLANLGQMRSDKLKFELRLN